MANLFKKRGRVERRPIEKKRFFKVVRDLAEMEGSSILASPFFRDRFVVFFSLLPCFLFVVSSIYSHLHLNLLPLQIPLFYSQVWGDNQLAERQLIYLPSGGAFVIGLTDFVLAFLFYPKSKVVAYLLIGVSSLISILAAVATYNIINLVR